MQDFVKDDIRHYKKAIKFYDDLAARLTAAGHCLDVYAASLDQVGLAEMHPAVAASGKVPPLMPCTCRQSSVVPCCKHEPSCIELACSSGHLGTAASSVQ